METGSREIKCSANFGQMKRLIGILPLLGALFFLSAACGSAGTLAQFRTTVGDIDVELFDQDKPVTVQNFIRYVNSPAYTNFQLIHRWSPGFVIQGGGFFVLNRYATNQGISFLPTFGAITNEYSVGPTYSNVYGTIAMARTGGQVNSATSQWFINLANNSFLDSVDGGFTVFGRVVQGTNTLQKFLPPYTNSLNQANIGGPLTELPYVGTNLIHDALIYVDITLLKVAVTTSEGGSRSISWNSVSNRINRVEYTTNLPPSWITLATTNGTGGRFTLTDTNSANSRAFYRVRIDY